MNILLVDDHSIVRTGYRSLIELMLPEFTIFEAASGAQTLQITNHHQIDILVMDINLDKESGLIVAKDCLTLHPRIAVIFFSMFEDGAILQRAMEIGASGYISKNSEPDTLISAIKVVAKGQKYIEQQLAVKLANQILTEKMDIQSLLTRREFDVFIRFSLKKTRIEVAEELGLSTKTISNTLTVIKRKLKVDVPEFRSIAARHGYIGTS